MRSNSECVNEKWVKQDYDPKDAEWLRALSLTAEYTDAADTLRRTIIKVALSKDIGREEKEARIDNLTRSIWGLMDMMAKDVLYNFGD